MNSLFRLSLCAAAIWPAAAQDRVKPLDPNKARLDYWFPIRPGGEVLRFHAGLSTEGKVTGLTIYRAGESNPYQVLPPCQDIPADSFNEYDDEREFVKHQDFNFDGFEDVQLLQFYHPHLGTSVYCIFVWDDAINRFRHEPAIPDTNPVAHPENRTITVHQDWQGGTYRDAVYRWMGPQLEVVEESGRGYGSANPKCGFTDYCSALVDGKLVMTESRPSGCEDRLDEALDCSKAPKRAPPRSPSTKGAVKK